MLCMVFHGRATMPNPKKKFPQLNAKKEKPTLSISHNDFKYDATEAVYITHVVNPNKFFVRKQHLQSVYENICEELDQEFSVASNAAPVDRPEIGMACVACVADVQAFRGAAGAGGGCLWARAVVRAQSGREHVRVQLVDSGELLLLPCSALHRIPPKIASVRALATECHLADETPTNKTWITGCVKLLKNYEGRLLKLTVDNREKANRARGSISVILHDNSDTENVICLNQEIIKHKNAVLSGVYKLNKKPVKEDEVASKKWTTTESRLAKQSEKKIAEVDLKTKDIGPLRLEVMILSCHSPSKIYISFIHQQNTFEKLYENMQLYYSKNKHVKTAHKWKVGDNCCTKCKQLRTWRRAHIMAIENEIAQVFFVDFAFIETVPLTRLRTLTSEFASFSCAARLCHLHGIVPAEGEKWPSVTKEYLKDLIDNYRRLVITNVGDFKGKSMPVELWAYHTEYGGALEPNTYEWICLNKRVIEQGLAVPDNSQTVTMSGSNKANREISYFFNTRGSINEWLQIDPVPMEFGKVKTIKQVQRLLSPKMKL